MDMQAHVHIHKHTHAYAYRHTVISPYIQIINCKIKKESNNCTPTEIIIVGHMPFKTESKMFEHVYITAVNVLKETVLFSTFSTPYNTQSIESS